MTFKSIKDFRQAETWSAAAQESFPEQTGDLLVLLFSCSVLCLVCSYQNSSTNQNILKVGLFSLKSMTFLG